MKKKWFFSLVLLGFLVSIVISGWPAMAVTIDSSAVLTLTQVKELALQNSPDIKKQEVAVELARINARDAEVAYYRTISANAFLSGSAHNTWDSAVDAHKDSEASLTNLKQKIVYDVEKNYLDILNIEKAIAAMTKSYQLQGDLVNIEKLKVELGLSTNYDLNEIINKSRDMKRQLDTLYNNKEKLDWQLNRAIGREPKALMELAPVTFNPVKIGTLKETTDVALQTSLAIQQFNRTVTDKEASIVTKQYTQSDQVEKLEFEIKNIKYQITDTEYNIKVALESAYEQMALKQSQLSDYRSAYEIEEQNYDNLKMKYELGLIGRVALDSSEIAFNQKSIDLEKAIYDYYLSVRKIDLAEKGIIVS